LNNNSSFEPFIGLRSDDAGYSDNMGQLIASYPSSISINKVIIKTSLPLSSWYARPLGLEYGGIILAIQSMASSRLISGAGSGFFLAFVALLLCLLFFLSWLAQCRQFVKIYELGLAIHSGLSHRYSLNWDQLAGILTSFIQERILHLQVRNDLNATLQLKDGSAISLPHP